MAVTEFDMAYPVLHMLSMRETETELDIFFRKAIEWNNPQPKIVMTDGAKNYATRVEKFFPCSLHRLCIWHVYRAWSGKIKQLYPKEWEKKLGKLISIQREVKVADFVSRFNSMLEDSSEEFKKYLSPYINDVEKWAAYARKKIGINVNMYIESFHRILKRDYLLGNSGIYVSHYEGLLQLRIIVVSQFLALAAACKCFI